MDGSPVVQLLTLWFVILVFIQTGSAGAGPLVTAAGVFALLLAYVIPIAILAVLFVQVVGE